ncbi:MAG: putative quinol monooxygenase [Sphingobacteriaceae bacterium]
MITRVVKLSFQPDKTAFFLRIFNQYQQLLAQSEGCTSLSLLKDVSGTSTYFTISKWNSEADLERYRQSTLFREIWRQVKPLFAEPAAAWSLEEVG